MMQQTYPYFRASVSLIPKRRYSAQDLAASALKSIFEQIEEIVVVAGTGDFIEPTIAINQRTGHMVRTKAGQLHVASSLQKKFPTLERVLIENEEIIAKVQAAVPRLMSTFSLAEQTHSMFPTAFATSPTTLFTDLHCVPESIRCYTTAQLINLPLRSVKVKFGAHVPAEASALSRLHEVPILSRKNEVPLIRHPEIDPINRRHWPHGGDSTDLAILGTPVGYRSPSYLLPATFDDRELLEKEVPVAFVGYAHKLGEPEFERLWLTVKDLRTLDSFAKALVEDQELLQREYVNQCLRTAFHNFVPKIMSLGHTLKKADATPSDPNVLIAVTNTSATCSSGSPYFLPSNPRFVIGQHLGGGVYSRTSDTHFPNYNVMMSVNNQEWVYRWTKYVLPNLPVSDHDAVRPYIKKHEHFLRSVNIFPEGF